jgi:DNA excision repair protein ERCC-3
MIQSCTRFFGKIHLILYKNHYFIYAPEYEALKNILNDEKIGRMKLFLNIHPKKILLILKKISKKLSKIHFLKKKFFFQGKKISFFEFLRLLPRYIIISVDSMQNKIEEIKKRCVQLDCPLLEEYDFINDSFILNITIELNSIATIRKYQEKALAKMFSRGRARSGVIVLPCGAGKTIVGITSVTIIKKQALIICNSTVSVEQWKKQFIKWSNIPSIKIKNFVAGQFLNYNSQNSDIIITTYSMISFGGQRAKLSASFLNEIKNREWGIVILD